jgi:hypothetical protein
MSGPAAGKIRPEQQSIADCEIRDLSDGQGSRAPGHFDLESGARKIEWSRSRTRGPQREQSRHQQRGQLGESEAHADVSFLGYTLSSFSRHTLAHLRFPFA